MFINKCPEYQKCFKNLLYDAGMAFFWKLYKNKKATCFTGGLDKYVGLRILLNLFEEINASRRSYAKQYFLCIIFQVNKINYLVKTGVGIIGSQFDHVAN